MGAEHSEYDASQPSEDDEPPAPPPKPLHTKAKGKPRGQRERRRKRAIPSVLDLLSGPKVVPLELVLHMMIPLGCDETTMKEEFELLSAKDISDAFQRTS